MKIQIYSFALACLISTGCTQNKSTPSSLITAVDAETLQQQEAADALLAKHKITFSKDYQGYQSDQKELLNPCDKDLLADLQEAKDHTRSAQDRVKSNADAQLYRDEALEFSRKVSFADKSLEGIVKNLHEYCAGESEQQNSCLSVRGQILVRINEHVSNTPAIHPYIRFNLSSAAGLTIFRIYRPVDPFVSSLSDAAEGDQTDAKIAAMETPDDLQAINECMKSRTISDLGTDVALTWQTLVNDMNTTCANLEREWTSNGLLSGYPAINKYCGIGISTP